MPDPMYRQIAEDLRRKIESGELHPGIQLPDELELKEQYNASRNTVREAVKWLIGWGLVETRRGHGTFVVKKIEPFVTTLDIAHGFGVEWDTAAYQSELTAERGPAPGQTADPAAAAGRRDPIVEPPRIEVHRATGIRATELELDEDAMILSRHQRRYIGDTPWSLQTTFYPMSYVERGATELLRDVDMPGGVVAYLEQILGVKQVGWRDKITVRTPDAVETAFFSLPDDGRIVVFENHRTSYDESGKPLRLTVTAYPTDRNQFVVTSGDVPPEKRMPEKRAADAANTENR